MKFVTKLSTVLGLLLAVLLLAFVAFANNGCASLPDEQFIITNDVMYAGWFGDTISSTKDWILDHALASIIGLVFMVISSIWGATKWGKALMKGQIPITKMFEIYRAVRKVRNKDIFLF